MYTLYTDKSEDFKCNIDVEGAKIADTQARLVLKNKNISLLFEGKVSSDGTCSIPITKLKNILEEGEVGEIKLEVIAEDTFFSPWEDEFEVKTNKKVTVEIANSVNNKPITENKIAVKVNIPQKKLIKEEITHGDILSEIFVNKGVTLKNFDKNSSMINKITEAYISKYKVKEDKNLLIRHIINQLT